MRPSKWHGLAVGLLLLVLAGLSYLTSDPRAAISGPESIVREVMAPLQTGMAAVSQWLAGAVETVGSIGRLQEDNRLLRQEVAALKAELQDLEELRRENERLREILGLRERLPHRVVVAQVAARPYNQWFSSITLNRGSKDGLRPGMPVVNAQGVVGHVESVTANTARVLLLTDPKSAVGGVTVDSEVPVLVEGTGDPAGRQAHVRPLVWGAELFPGDRVVTSGLSHIFPKGLAIGEIESVSQDALGLKQQAILRPYVDFNRLDWVAVILETVDVDIDLEIRKNDTEGDEEGWPQEASETD